MEKIIIIPHMEGVTTALVAMLFVCLIFPSLVKHTRQFYSVVAMVIGIILLHALGAIVQSTGFAVFTGVVTCVLQAMSIMVIVMCVGGLTARDLAGDIKGAYEVIRRGENEKEVIIPIGPNARRGTDAPAAPVVPATPREPREPEKVVKIDVDGNDIIEDKPQT